MFRQVVQQHANRYPRMGLRDYMKLAYQSEFGPEHMVVDEQKVSIRLEEEWLEPMALSIHHISILLEIERLLQTQKQVVIAIDGRCGSGKTSLATLLQEVFGCHLVHMDDFYLPFNQRVENWREIPGGNMDWERLIEEVMEPLSKGQSVTYRPFRCHTGTFEETSLLRPHPLTVIEGSYAHYPLLTDYYDLKVFLTCSKEAQLSRLQKREGTYIEMFQKTWIPLEEQYFRIYQIEAHSDRRIDTTQFFSV